MNSFKSLDLLFPTLPNRHCGEVVTTTVLIFRGVVLLDQFSWKRKAWYVNASVNAFHMHRGLCRDLRDRFGSELSSARLREAKALLRMAVMNSYLVNHQTGEQYHQYRLNLPVLGRTWQSMSLFWDVDRQASDLREIC